MAEIEQKEGQPEDTAKLAQDAKVDPGKLFGQIAVERELASERQVHAAMELQTRLKAENAELPLGEILAGLGSIDVYRISEVLSLQAFAIVRAEDKLFGRLAIRNTLATQAQVDEALAEQDRRARKGPPYRRLGELLIEKKALKVGDVKTILAAQSRLDPDTGRRSIDFIPTPVRPTDFDLEAVEQRLRARATAIPRTLRRLAMDLAALQRKLEVRASAIAERIAEAERAAAAEVAAAAAAEAAKADAEARARAVARAAEEAEARPNADANARAAAEAMRAEEAARAAEAAEAAAAAEPEPAAAAEPSPESASASATPEAATIDPETATEVDAAAQAAAPPATTPDEIPVDAGPDADDFHDRQTDDLDPAARSDHAIAQAAAAAARERRRREKERRKRKREVVDLSQDVDLPPPSDADAPIPPSPTPAREPVAAEADAPVEGELELDLGTGATAGEVPDAPMTILTEANFDPPAGAKAPASDPIPAAVQQEMLDLALESETPEAIFLPGEGPNAVAPVVEPEPAPPPPPARAPAPEPAPAPAAPPTPSSGGMMDFEEVLAFLAIDEDQLTMLVAMAKLRGVKDGPSMKFDPGEVAALKEAGVE